VTTREDVSRLAQLQYALLENACRLVADKGRLVYATCSVLGVENERVIEKLLKQHPDFELIVPEKFTYKDLIGEDRMLRTYPGFRSFDNIFAACLARR
jgi:16S rRNA (cytosine967-C5)-methyltransferase